MKRINVFKVSLLVFLASIMITSIAIAAQNTFVGTTWMYTGVIGKFKRAAGTGGAYAGTGDWKLQKGTTQAMPFATTAASAKDTISFSSGIKTNDSTCYWRTAGRGTSSSARGVITVVQK